jgi:hypothetical protein
MQFNNISDYEKMLMDNVTKVEVGEKVFYLRITGPLNFDIISNMSDESISKEDRAVRALCACLCDSGGVGLFDVNDDRHIKIVKEFQAEEVAALVNTIWGFFTKKKA